MVYDASEMEAFQGRTKQVVADAYSAARYAGETYVNGDSSTYYSETPSFEDPYDGGQLTEDTHIAMTEMANFYRWLVGVDTLQATSAHDDQMQAGALVRCYDFNHSVSAENKPDDMDEDFWNYGASVSHNILARFYTPQGAITGFMNEGYSLSSGTWGTLGHRMTIIGTNVSDLEFGYCGGITIGKKAASDNTAISAFSAFPAPGYMPTNLISYSSSAWSVNLDTSQIYVADTSAVTVTISDLSTGEQMVRTLEEDTLQAGTSYIYFVQPEGPYTDKSYAVTISGLVDTSSEKDAEIQYTVRFFDVTEYADSYVESYTTAFSEYVVYETMDSTETLKKIGASLDREIVIETETGFTATVSLAGAWKLDEENSCWKNSVDLSTLPSNVSDSLGVLDEVIQPYTISDDYYDSYNSLYISPSEVEAGESCTMYVYRTMTTTYYSSIFKITKNTDGSYAATEAFSSDTSAEFDAEASASYGTYHNYHIYQLTNCTQKDSGAYFSIYHAGKYSGHSAYVSTSIKTLRVNGDEIFGDIDGDGSVTLEDASLCLVAYANVAAGNESGLTDEQETKADVDIDGSVTIQDALYILQYYAQSAVGNDMSWDEIFELF